jgi:hypothetical protein
MEVTKTAGLTIARQLLDDENARRMSIPFVMRWNSEKEMTGPTV